jgi:MYXO-CTERM domain-containing protein
MTCVEVSYCVRTMMCFSRDGEGTPVTDFFSTCGPGCSSGGCRAARVCSSSPVPPLLDAGRRRDAGRGADAGSGREHATYGCGCRAPGGDDAPFLPIALTGLALGVAALLIARRRGR